MKQNIYTIYVRTGDDPDAGTDSSVYFQLFGSSGQTEEILLPARDIFSFETSGTDKFILQVPDLGDLTRCCLRLEATSDGTETRWELKDVRVEDDDTDRTWTFAFNRWLVPGSAGSETVCAARGR
ncbi:PLAT/LH2 domain-containing protein [Aggregatilinea lenta]|uniref:PLAT/LH2 domain-containing protein n=1 Tax=Aggregatilinea lenta TaxID=913108 RepID=UPI000E5B0B79|nr:PLAT/LH2 domain-containing protein [Aggregatilinea lenta]